MDATRLPPAAAAAPAPAADDAAAKTMMDGGQSIAGRFLIMGAGSANVTGRLFEARDTQHGGALVSLKLVDAKVLPNASMADRALRELKQLGKVTSERIAKVIDQGKASGDQVYVATEVIGGRTLEELVTAEGPLPLERAAGIVLQIGEALTEAQKVGVIHRDVAPRNVHVIAGDKVKVTEFGLAEAVNDKVFGAPAYLSPEQVEARPVDQRSNIYSLGAVFYYALTGHPPFEGDAQTLLQQQLNATAQPPSARKPGLPAEVDRVILKALEKSGGRRHLTLRQLLSEIEAISHAKPEVAAARTVMAEAPAPAPVLRAPDAANARTMMGIPSPLAGVTAPSMASAPATAPSMPAAAPATTAPSMPVAHSSDANARTMMAEAPKVQPSSPMSSAATMMAQPSSAPTTTVEKKPVNASPQVQAAVAAAQAQVAAQKAVAAAQPTPPAAKGGFRETAWFKAGEIQEELEKAKAAADAKAAGDVLAPTGTTGTHDAVDAGGEVDLSKVSVDASDKARLSLKTGATQMMQAVKAPSSAVPGERMDEQEMLAEIDTSKRKFIIAGLIVLVIAAIVVLVFVMGGKKDEAAPGKAENAAPPPTAVATAPPAPTATPPPTVSPPPVATPPPAAPTQKAEPPPTEANPEQLLSEAKAAVGKDNLTLATDLVTKAAGAGANAKQLKKLQAQLVAKLDKKLKTAKKAKDKAGEDEARALKERLASLKAARK
jgi:serine/threonine-protein kinase